MTDYAMLAEGLDEIREMLRAMVAAIVADGFTEEQARSIVTGWFTLVGKGDSKTDEEES